MADFLTNVAGLMLILMGTYFADAWRDETEGQPWWIRIIGTVGFVLAAWGGLVLIEWYVN